MIYIELQSAAFFMVYIFHISESTTFLIDNQQFFSSIL